MLQEHDKSKDNLNRKNEIDLRKLEIKIQQAKIDIKKEKA